MKALQSALFSVLLLGIFLPSEQAEKSCPGQHHSEDSCSSIDTPEPLPLSYVCVDITYNGKKDDRSPIVVVHGFTIFKEAYMELVEYFALKTARKVCAVDLRNHGDSPWSDETDSKAMASDLALFTRTINADKIVVVGHSLGGKIAVEFALTYPEKVEKIVSEDMRPNGMSEEVIKIFETSPHHNVMSYILTKIPKGSTEAEAKTAVIKLINKHFDEVNVTMRLSEFFADKIPLECSEEKCKWKSNLDVLNEIWQAPLKYWHDSKGKCEKPALFIYGGISPFKIGDVKEEIFELFPNAKMYKVENEGHCLNTLPEYRREVVNFINAKD